MLWIKEIDYKTAKGFIERHHYSHSMPRGKSVASGGTKEKPYTPLPTSESASICWQMAASLPTPPCQ